MKLVSRTEELGEVAESIGPVVGLDIETTSLRPFDGNIRLVQLNTGNQIFIIDLFRTGTLGPVLERLASPGVIKIVHNAAFEVGWFLHHLGTELHPTFDSFRASVLLYNGKGLGHNLYDLYGRELRMSPSVEDCGASDWSAAELSDRQLQYAADDVEHLLRLRDVMKPKLAKAGLNRIAMLEFSSIVPVASMELNGLYLDRQRWSELAARKIEECVRLRHELLGLMPHPKSQLALPGLSEVTAVNLNSPKQVRESFARLGVTLDSTDSDALALVLAGASGNLEKVVRTFLKYREVNKQVTSFGENYLQHIHPSTGRVHTHYWPATETGRWSCLSPNLQQQPRSREYRECWRAVPGRKLVGSDYGQIELVLAAEISQDRTLCDIYRDGQDAHLRTASITTGVSIDKVTKEQRQAAKAVNFGLVFGMGAERLVVYAQSSYGVTFSLQQAKKFIKAYFAGYSGIKRWHGRAFAEASRTGMVRTPLGRSRYLKEGDRNAILNTPVQGGAADGLKIALRKVYDRLRQFGGRARMVHMVHDEIILEVDDEPDLLESVKHELHAGMLEGMYEVVHSVPVTAEAKIGDSWAAIK